MKYHLGPRYFSFVVKFRGLYSIKAGLLFYVSVDVKAQWDGGNLKHPTVHKETPGEIAQLVKNIKLQK
jgi:hypothetical protein